MEKGKSRLQRTQEDVEELKEIMKDNLQKAEERGDKLSDLEARADVLQQKSKTFRETCRRLKLRNQEDNNKRNICIGVVVTLLISTIIIIAMVIHLVRGRQ